MRNDLVQLSVAVPSTDGQRLRRSGVAGSTQSWTCRRGCPNTFEYEYVRMGKAWLDWRDGESDGARRQLEKLAKELPAGSIVRGTAVWLIEQIDQGEEPSKRLNFVPDRESSRSKTTPPSI